MNTEEQGKNSIEKIIDSSLLDEKDGLFRVDFFYPLVASMKVKSINDKKTDSKATKVLVDDIGSSGLKLISNLLFPVNPAIMFNFKILILNETINLTGKIVWKEESVNGLFKYGIKFFHNEDKEQYLTQIVNTLQVSIRKSPITSGCNFYTGDIYSFFLDMNTETDISTDLGEVKNLIMKSENAILNGYKELLEIYRKNKDNEEIEASIINFVGKVKQVVNKFDV